MSMFENRYRPSGYVGWRNAWTSNIYTFPIKVEAGAMIDLNGEKHLALAKTKQTPIELSNCRACSIFRKPVCELLKCEEIIFEKIN